jgi:hypothetical protein
MKYRKMKALCSICFSTNDEETFEEAYDYLAGSIEQLKYSCGYVGVYMREFTDKYNKIMVGK